MFKFFKKNKKEPESLKEILEHLKRLEENYEKTSREFKEFKEKSRECLQKVGIVRFNPFKEVGGDQSFSVAVLDANGTGLIVTSHYGRETNRVYAKSIKNGQSQYALSAEEKKAINEAMGNSNYAKRN